MRALSEPEKQKIAAVVGKDLNEQHGKKKYYSQREVRSSLDRYGYALDIHCWAYCLFMSHGDFDLYHASIGEACDYTEMKTSMLASVTDHQSDSWFDFDWDMSWSDLPDFDLSSLFDIFD